jgi:hypothetical protein
VTNLSQSQFTDTARTENVFPEVLPESQHFCELELAQDSENNASEKLNTLRQRFKKMV